MAAPRAAKAAIPDKLYFKIGEVARIVAVAPSVLRYWETEFALLKPGKTPSGHRLYRRRDVETLLEIKRLLHDERFTIAGARRRLKATLTPQKAAPRAPRPAPSNGSGPSPVEVGYRALLMRVRKEVEALCRMLR